MLIRVLIDLYGTTELLKIKPARAVDKIFDEEKRSDKSRTEGVGDDERK